jgi:hypothetical protein
MDPRTFCRPAEFSLVVARTAVAIRAADPTALVLPGGLWKPFDRPGAGYGRALCASSAFLAHIDGMNVHAYPPRDPGLLWVGVDNVAACGKPVWVTEFSTSSVGADRSEATQAAELLEALLEGLRRGTVRVYWHSLTEPPTFYDGGAGPGMRGRHLRVGSAEDVDRTGPHPRWRATHRKLAAWALRSFLARYGDLPRSGVEAVDVGPGGRGVRLGDDIVAWGTTATLPGDHLVTPLVAMATGQGAEPEAPASARITGPIDLSRGPVRIASVSPD